MAASLEFFLIIFRIKLDLHYDKRDILESYLNEVFLGQDGQRRPGGVNIFPWQV
ncbi:penicillin-binding protein 1B [Pseudomonas aeruginosa MPAO1/P2]|nr:penicillin-binding protein 1B [Pseudomonas aeruginosa MPAO1/P2]